MAWSKPPIPAKGRASDAGAPPAARGRLRVRAIAASVAVVVGGFCAASVWTLDDLRQATWTQAVRDETNLLNALSQDIERNVEIYGLALQAVIDGLADPGLASLSPRMQDLVLFGRSTTAKDLGSVLVLDRDGKVVRGLDHGAIGADLGDREYFKAQKEAPGRGLFISAPFTRRITGRDEVIALSRALVAPDGSFAGVVAGTMHLSYFKDLLSRADLGAHGSAHLLRLDGVSLMRVPYDPGQSGLRHAGTAIFGKVAASPSGTFVGRSSVDGRERIYSFTHIGDLPLALDVALDTGDVFAVWRSKAATIAAALATLSAVGIGLGLRLCAQLRRTARAEDALSRSEAQYRLFADHAQDLIVRLDRTLQRTYVSPGVTEMLGHASQDLVGLHVADLVHPQDWPHVAALIGTAQAEGVNMEATYRLRHRAGHHVWVEGRFSLVAEDGGFVVVLRDVSRRKAAEERLETLNVELAAMARRDALTGLANRRGFDEALAEELRKAEHTGAPVSLVLLDVDRFKAFNDRYGHPEGDTCLQAVARAVLSGVRRPGDHAARYGGEEIAIVLPGTDEAGAERTAERIRTAVQALSIPHAGNPTCGAVVTASLGCATVRPREAEGAGAELVAEADARLYEAKRLGRNRVVSGIAAASTTLSPSDEAARLDALADLGRAGLDTPSDSLDAMARLTAQLFATPMAFVSLVGQDETVLVGRHAVDLERVPREDAYCAHTIQGEEPLVIPSTAADPRFSESPLTKGGIGFYAGAPLVSGAGDQRVGALCIVDSEARPPLDEAEKRLLAGLAALVSDDLRRRLAASPVPPDRKSSLAA